MRIVDLLQGPRTAGGEIGDLLQRTSERRPDSACLACVGSGVEMTGQGVEGHGVIVIVTFLGWARSRGDRDFPWKGTAWKGKVSW